MAAEDQKIAHTNPHNVRNHFITPKDVYTAYVYIYIYRKSKSTKRLQTG